MYSFSYHQPTSIDDAVKLLGKTEDSKLVSGGMTLLPTLKQRLAQPTDLIDLGKIQGLSYIRASEDKVVIGGLTTHGMVGTSADVAAAIPALAWLAQHIGDPAVRNRGTIGGSIANNDPAADYPSAVVALKGTVKTNQRELAGEDFFVGLFETALQPDEIVTEIAFMKPKRAAYMKFRNPASRYAIVGVFLAEHSDGIRLAVIGAGSHVFRIPEMEAALATSFTPEAIKDIKVDPDGLNADIHASAEYRAHLVTVMAQRAVKACLCRAAKLDQLIEARSGGRGGAAGIEETTALLAAGGYIADRSLATAVFLALRLGRPLLLEGEAGVGKTEIAKVLAAGLGRRLIRLQCYEGLDVAAAVYEWNYARQMIAIRMAETGSAGAGEAEIFSDRFLIKRPLLQALEPDPAGAPILLIDELDRSDEPFEAYLLEVLSDFQVTIPEIGTIRAAEPPIVIVTSNRTREIHDALKRRCLYYWVDYPSAERELEILSVKAPGAARTLSQEVVAFVQRLRGMNLFKLPGVAETIDWAEALMQLDVLTLTPQAINDTLGVLLKYQDDISRIQGSEALAILNQIRSEVGQPG